MSQHNIADSTNHHNAQAGRVLFVSCVPRDHAVTRYRCTHLAEVLTQAGWQTDIAYIGDSKIRVAHDIVVLHRVCAVREGRKVAQAARRIGATLVYSADDLVWDAACLPPAAGRMRAFARRHLAILQQADAALLSTQYLREQAERSAPHLPAFVLPNFLSDTMWQQAQVVVRPLVSPLSHTPTLGYFSGTATHNHDLATVAPALARLMTDYPQVQLYLGGPVQLPAVLLPFASRVTRLPFVGWHDLPALLAQVDVNLAPLDLTQAFNQGKSAIKFWEAAAVRVPTVASASHEYQRIVAEGNTDGLMLCRTADHWYAALVRLVTDEGYREQYATAAYRYARRHATPAAHRTAILRTFGDLLLYTNDVAWDSEITVRAFLPKYVAKAALSHLRRQRLPLTALHHQLRRGR